MEQPSWIPLRLRESNSNPAGSAVLVLAANTAAASNATPLEPLRIPRHAASCTAASNATASNTTPPAPLLPAQKSKII